MGWLIGWSVSKSVCPLFGHLVGLIIGQVGLFVGQSVNWLIVLLFFVYQPQKFGCFEEFNANFDIKSDLLCFKEGRLDFARALS